MLAMLVGVETIAPRELHQWVEGRRVAVIDCNSRQHWEGTRPGTTSMASDGQTRAEVGLTTGKALGITVSQRVLLRADEIFR